MKEYRTITADGLAEEEIKKSRFICHLKRVTSEEEARNFINTVKKTHYRATHNCSAFILGKNMEIKRSSDDGEPSGTAGVPMLTVLENNQLTNVAAVVTRYFGGIKLGAGGLIRAYAGSVASAISEIGIVKVKKQQGIAITMNYSQYQEFANWRTTHDLEEYDTEFLADVQTMIFTNEEELQDITNSLIEFYHGKIQIEKANFRVIEIPVH
ncbi:MULTISPECIES: YigZ family protein [unclassified Streptococcus]|uniref:YigZ family protein n=1 Tax=unclassified Streptococcus TaxID=2608887 RepID=UPI0010729F72|nr:MULTISPECIES: YigZ family protein [unclassified Streptococcus]MBF0787853.1 YigZ family protein [Streptococcus sp. 19428wC2_LYSM12]MCQ9211136.1 YigZ family protein [Streptococcus sp. B01]MCQ9214411.1 YigZ family protein [Streptococcus sp. O1]TFV05104.1 YigZ family protein [Streptococcus sp. LYSM12]